MVSFDGDVGRLAQRGRPRFSEPRGWDAAPSGADTASASAVLEPRKLHLNQGRPRWLTLATERTLGIDVQRIDRLARGHEQAIALEATETDVGAALG